MEMTCIGLVMQSRACDRLNAPSTHGWALGTTENQNFHMWTFLKASVEANGMCHHTRTHHLGFQPQQTG